MNKSVIIGGLAAIILIAGGFFIFNKPAKDPTPTNQPAASNSTQSTSSSDNSPNQSSTATITYSDSGFSPSTLTVKAGTKVTIKNTSSDNLQFDSDPHPVHSDDPELNVGNIAPGESMIFTPTVTGTHGYHNHLNSADTGILIVQ